MSCPKSAAAHIGRVGMLAVTLGVGAAVITGTGVARADTPGTGSADSAAAGPQASTASASASQPARRAARSAAITRKPASRQPAAQGSGSAAPVTPIASALRSSTVVPEVTTPNSTSDPVLTTVPDAAAPTLTPSITSAPSVTTPVHRLTSELLAAKTTPGAPLESAKLWALMALTRRDFAVGARSATARVMAASAQANASVATAAVVATPPSTLTSAQTGWVTGQRNTAYPGLTWAQINNTSWANIYGTDVGVMWLNEDNGLTQLAFGDTFSGPNMTGNWRSNVLLLSSDTELYDGLTLIDTGPAFQFIPAARNQVFFIGSEVTNIPSAAVYANGQNYVNYFSVKSWDAPGYWTTNYSAISMYNPATDKWELQPSSVRSAGWFRSSTPYVAGSQNFQQAAYVLEPETKVAPGGTRYVYAFGTPSGRAGSAFLSRVPEGAITDLAQYEYWDGSAWVPDKPAVAAPIIGDSPNSAGLFGFVRDIANNPNFFGGWFAGLVGAKTGGNVSELSVQYNDYLDKYVVLYGNGANNVILRTADTPEGVWSDPVTIATSFQYPGLYAPMVHPLSGTGELTDAAGDPDISTLYWNMSLWGNYNVVLMKTDLTPLKTTLV